MTLDGYIGQSSGGRLVGISSVEDYAYRDQLRASHDAILMGANTVRKDQPRGAILDEKVRKERRNPTKVTLTRSGDLDPENVFFTHDSTSTHIYSHAQIRPHFPDHVHIHVGDWSLENVLEDLYSRGTLSVLIEGGSEIITYCIQNNLYTTLRVSVGPFVLSGEDAIPAFADAAYPLGQHTRLELVSVEQLGDCGVMTYHNPYAK